MADVDSPYPIRFSKKAQKDVEKLTVQQQVKLQRLLQNNIAKNPYLGKTLKGDLDGFYSYDSIKKTESFMKFTKKIKLYWSSEPKPIMAIEQPRSGNEVVQ